MVNAWLKQDTEDPQRKQSPIVPEELGKGQFWLHQEHLNRISNE